VTVKGEYTCEFQGTVFGFPGCCKDVCVLFLSYQLLSSLFSPIRFAACSVRWDSGFRINILVDF